MNRTEVSHKLRRFRFLEEILVILPKKQVKKPSLQ